MTDLVNHNNNNTTTDVSSLSTPDTAVTDKVYFRPALFYQVIQPYHIVDSGLEFKMNFDTKENKARFPNTINFENNPERLEQLKKQACAIVNQNQQRDDRRILIRRMKNAATWNDIKTIQIMISTCYVTPEVAIPTLIEAISHGHIDIVKFLIDETGCPITKFCSQSTIKTPLHHAAESGHENILKLLLSKIETKEECLLPTADTINQTIIDILRNNERSIMARRILQIVNEKQNVPAPTTA